MKTLKFLLIFALLLNAKNRRKAVSEKKKKQRKKKQGTDNDFAKPIGVRTEKTKEGVDFYGAELR
jgi:hypothetical protein